MSYATDDTYALQVSIESIREILEHMSTVLPAPGWTCKSVFVNGDNEDSADLPVIGWSFRLEDWRSLNRNKEEKYKPMGDLLVWDREFGCITVGALQDSSAPNERLVILPPGEKLDAELMARTVEIIKADLALEERKNKQIDLEVAKKKNKK